MEQNKASTQRQNEDGEQYIETNRRSARRERLDEQIKEAMRQIAQEEVGRGIETAFLRQLGYFDPEGKDATFRDMVDTYRRRRDAQGWRRGIIGAIIAMVTGSAFGAFVWPSLQKILRLPP